MSQPVQLPDRSVRTGKSLSQSEGSNAYRNGHLNLDTFSPVNQNGSFEFDRVLKSGMVYRRVKSKHAFKPSWKAVYLVLRPNLLSVYKDEQETRLRLSVTLSEVTAVAPIKSPRSRRDHVFGIFSPSKNYRFQATSEKEANDWIDRIRAEARVDEDEEAYVAAQAGTRDSKHCDGLTTDNGSDHSDVEPSSPDVIRGLSPGHGGSRVPYMQDYSGNDVTSYSEFSDGPSTGAKQRSATSLPKLSVSAPPDTETRPPLPRDASQTSDGGLGDPERVVCHGYLQCLRAKRGVRQWKKLWVVLRPKSLAFYKNEQEYSVVKIVPMDQVINAAEIDPMSRSKNCCLQVIAEDKSYRFCAPDEEALAKWLGALKSVIVARKRITETSTTSRRT
ncbi:PH domain protein [Paecilomyces variotii No. 5]|uniref:PH domain protein n=1 Tax=Byssochlamys spectabilis (strain No. 5 / NBRC 109023) TaxID=1356009 RepID=V5GDE2_BYSSN|nr:PH domain protein [Paecilomyces variotii No. 5]